MIKKIPPMVLFIIIYMSVIFALLPGCVVFPHRTSDEERAVFLEHGLSAGQPVWTYPHQHHRWPQ